MKIRILTTLDFKSQLLWYFILSIQKVCKQNRVFRNLIAEKTHFLENHDYHLLFADNSSKGDDKLPACAMVDTRRQVQVNHVLHESIWTFVTAAKAILQFTNLTKANSKCSPSQIIQKRSKTLSERNEAF